MYRFTQVQISPNNSGKVIWKWSVRERLGDLEKQRERNCVRGEKENRTGSGRAYTGFTAVHTLRIRTWPSPGSGISRPSLTCASAPSFSTMRPFILSLRLKL